MVHYGYYVEMACLEFSCAVLWPLYIAQFIAYRFTPPKRRNVRLHRLLQLGVLALICQTVRCMDMDSVFGLIGWAGEAVLTDQVSSFVIFAAARVQLLSADTLCVLLAKKTPRALQWTLWVTAGGYQLVTAVTACVLLALVPGGPISGYTPAERSRIDWVRGVRVVALAVACVSLSLASCLTLLALRGKVAACAQMLLQQESNRTRGLELATAANANNNKNNNNEGGERFRGESVTAPSATPSPHVAVVAGAVGIVGTRTLRVEPLHTNPMHLQPPQQQQQQRRQQRQTMTTTAASPLSPYSPATAYAWQDPPTPPSPAPTPTPALAPVVAEVVPSSEPVVSVFSLRLSALRSASGKLTRLLLVLNIVAWVGVVSNVTFLTSGALHSESMSPPDSSRLTSATVRRALYAAGQQMAILITVAHCWIDTAVWTRHVACCWGSWWGLQLHQMRSRSRSSASPELWPPPGAGLAGGAAMMEPALAGSGSSGGGGGAGAAAAATGGPGTDYFEGFLPFWETLWRGAPDVSDNARQWGPAVGQPQPPPQQQQQMQQVQPHQSHPDHQQQHSPVQQQQQQQQHPQSKPHPLAPPSPTPLQALSPSSAPGPGSGSPSPLPHAARTLLSPATATATATSHHSPLGGGTATRTGASGGGGGGASSWQRVHTFVLQDGPAFTTTTTATAPTSSVASAAAAAVPRAPVATSVDATLAAVAAVSSPSVLSPPFALPLGRIGLFGGVAPRTTTTTTTTNNASIIHSGGGGGGSGANYAAAMAAYGRRHHHLLQQSQQRHVQAQRLTSGLLDSRASHAPTGLSMRSGMTSFQAQRRGEFDDHDDDDEELGLDPAHHLHVGEHSSHDEVAPSSDSIDSPSSASAAPVAPLPLLPPLPSFVPVTAYDDSD